MQLPADAQIKEQQYEQKKKVHKFWRLRRQKRKSPSTSSGEYLHPLEAFDQDSSSNELDDSDQKEHDQDEYKLGGYERDEEEEASVSLQKPDQMNTPI